MFIINDIGHTRLIEMDIETDPKLPPIASRPYTLPLKHQGWVRKELEDLEKAGIIQRCLSPYASPILIVPQQCPPGSTVQETRETLCQL